MTFSTLLRRSLTHFWRTNLAVIAGVGVAVSVLAGALLVGTSVRASLRDLALLRLGQVDHVVTAGLFFREALADELLASGALLITLPPEDVLRRRLKYQTKELPNGKIGWRYDIAIRDARRKGTVRPSEDLWPEWERITCPILVTRGMVTDTLTPERAQEMMDRNSNAKWVEIERAHHMVMEENPDKFLEEVSAWLKI